MHSMENIKMKISWVPLVSFSRNGNNIHCIQCSLWASASFGARVTQFREFLFLYIYFCNASAWAQDLAHAKQAFYLWTTPKSFSYNLKMILFILWEFLICTQYVLLKSTPYSLLQLMSHSSHWTNIIIKSNYPMSNLYAEMNII